MSEQYFNRLRDAIADYCKSINIHTACFHCKNDCPNKYSRWSGQMPFGEYCEKYEQVDEV